MKKLIILLFFLGALGLSAMFYYVDGIVGNRLAQPEASNTPSIYSDVARISSGNDFNLAYLKHELAARNYRQVGFSAEKPGEFVLSAESARIFAREFRQSDGTLRPPTRYRVNIPSKKVIAEDSEQETALLLEPLVIAHLGLGNAAQDIRANRHLNLKQIPDVIQKAIIAIEDERFYKHHGIDIVGIGRAMLSNLKAMRVVQGGSTLTQQLAKNLFFSSERSLKRKVLEALAALSLERRLNKPQILELYLNEVYLGQEGAVAIHGVAEAARNFFGKSLEELNIAESALLAGMIKAPSNYAPRRHLKRALARRELVLSKMRELNYINESQLQQARNSVIKLAATPEYARFAPYYIDALSNSLGEQVNLQASGLPGLSIYTGINTVMQQCAEQAISEGLQQIEKQFPKLIRRNSEPLQAALVSIEPFSGKVRSWVGGRDFAQSQFNRVSQASRQIGSTVKPFVYLTALDPSLNRYKVATPISILSDEPVKVDLITKDSWEPENFDHKYRGDVTLRYALENSLNLPAVYVAQRVGIHAVAETVRDFEVSDRVQEVPSLALGSLETTLLRLTNAFGALANGGQFLKPRVFISALDSTGSHLASQKIIGHRVANEDAVFVLTDILQGVVERGTAKSIRKLGYHAVVAGKTGTSNDARDTWFVGFSPDLVTGVWVGYDDNTKTNLTGGSAAAPIWTRYMQCLEPYHQPLNFIAPPGVTTVKIDSSSFQRAGSNCPEDSVISELFVKGSEPLQYCQRHDASSEDQAADSELIEQVDRPERRHKSFWDILTGN